jgi:hypothetical protein
MQIKADTPEEYIKLVPADKRETITRLRKIILDNLPEGFEEVIGYGMIGYVVPKSIYPAGYHADPRLPLPFMNLGSQKNHIALHHLGLYANDELLKWFTREYSNETKHLPDMGKGCIRFKKPEQVPNKVIGELVSKVTVDSWITNYEENVKSKPKKI